MAISTIFWRPVNCFRSKAVRAASKHTSNRGLARIWRKTPELRGTITQTVANKINSGTLPIREASRFPEMLLKASLASLGKKEIYSTYVSLEEATILKNNTGETMGISCMLLGGGIGIATTTVTGLWVYSYMDIEAPNVLGPLLALLLWDIVGGFLGGFTGIFCSQMLFSPKLRDYYTNKIAMLRRGALTNPSLLVKYAVKNIPILSVESQAYIINHPEIHETAVNILARYLFSRKSKTEKQEMEQHHHDDAPDYVTIRVFPLRVEAKEILRKLLVVTTGPLNTRIQNLLETAPPSTVG